MDQNGTSPWFSGWYVHNRLSRQFLLGGASNNIPGWEEAGCKLNATKTQMMNVFVRLERDEFSRSVLLFSSPKAPYPELYSYSVFCQEKHHWCGFFSTGRYSMRHLWIAAKTCFLAHSLTLLLTCWLARSTDFTYPLSSSLFSHQVYLPTWPWEFSLGFVTLGTAAVFGAWYQIHEVAASTACSEHPVSVSV